MFYVAYENNDKKCTFYFFFPGIDEQAIVELKRPKADDISLGSELLLKCQITGNPEPTFLWYHNKFRY